MNKPRNRTTFCSSSTSKQSSKMVSSSKGQYLKRVSCEKLKEQKNASHIKNRRPSNTHYRSSSRFDKVSFNFIIANICNFTG